MGGEWQSCILGDLISVKHGWAFKGAAMDEEVREGPIVVAIGNFEYSGGFRFESTRVKRYTDEFPREYILDAGDILLAMTCQTAGGEILGIPGRIPANEGVYLHNQRLGKVVLKDKQAVSPDYLYWLFLSRPFNQHLYLTATGTKILHTSPTKIEAYEFQLPPMEEQEAIAHILGTLDEKIELNRQMNATLEAMAQALFKSWFVDFDPVIDNALAASNPIPEPLQARAEARAALGDQRKPLPDAIQQQFPSSFVFNDELGWLPEGWSGLLQDLLILQRGFDLPKKDRSNGIYPLVAASGQDGTHDEFKVKAPGVTTGRSGRIGKVVFVHRDFWPLNTTLWIKEFKCSSPYHAYFLLQELDLDRFTTGSAVPTLNRNHIHGESVVNPSRGAIDAFDRLVAPLFERLSSSADQVSSLAATRDSLLPKLLSGQLRITDAEKQVAEVV